MKIGIGLTSYKRPDLLNHFQQQLKNCPPENEYVLHIAQDIENIARAKNECLFHLKDCDYIFLFDDDTFPKQSYWDVPFIDSGLPYSLYMNGTYSIAQELFDLTRYHDCSGCFLFITKELFSKVGYFNPGYGRYGYEHMGYSQRIKKITNDWAFICLNKTAYYIHSLDLDGARGWNVHHEPTISFEDRKRLSDANKHIYEQEVNNKEVYYNYQ